MELTSLTGRQKTRLRGLGQRLAPSLKIGKAGVTAALVAELGRRLGADELVKLRFLGVDREEREALGADLARRAGCHALGSLGHTALFYRENPDSARRRIGSE
jgi:RNA-binding protein